MLKFILDNIALIILFVTFVWYEKDNAQAFEINKERGALNNYINMFSCVERCIQDSLDQYSENIHEQQQFRFGCIKPCYKDVFLPNIIQLD
tara:strand:- start:3057 stop:3329 length:273 start_codon:yes stop_codon:yes gene_type:complete